MTTWNKRTPVSASIFSKRQPIWNDLGRLEVNTPSPFFLATNNGETIIFHTGIVTEAPSVWTKRPTI